MSGLTARNQAGQSGLVAPKVDFQRFTTAGTDDAGWVKPGDVSIVLIHCIGAGGGGGGGEATQAGGGGGGGAFAWACFSADALPATLDIIIGAGGLAKPGHASASDPGGNGGDTEVHVSSGLTEAGKILLKAYGGGGGGGATADNGTGGGGGGTGGAGGQGSSDGTRGTGGLPDIQGSTAGDSLGGRGGLGGQRDSGTIGGGKAE